eukprot:COSAG01_NODE_51706_length_352_cov_2.509881_1_plen_53_part_10
MTYIHHTCACAGDDSVTASDSLTDSICRLRCCHRRRHWAFAAIAMNNMIYDSI